MTAFPALPVAPVIELSRCCGLLASHERPLQLNPAWTDCSIPSLDADQSYARRPRFRFRPPHIPRATGSLETSSPEGFPSSLT